LVGAKKLVLDRNELKERSGEAQATNMKTSDLYATIDQVLNEYFVVELHGDGSKEHTKAGLSKEKVLVKAFGRRYHESGL